MFTVIDNIKGLRLTLLTMLGCWALCGSVLADDGVEVIRDIDELPDLLRPIDQRPVDERDIIDTALLFTGAGNEVSVVRCVAFGRNGQRLGAAWLRVPGKSLRFMLASDLVNDLDFLGSVHCHSGGRVIGSEVVIGLINTDIDVIQNPGATRSTIIYPVVVSR